MKRARATVGVVVVIGVLGGAAWLHQQGPSALPDDMVFSVVPPERWAIEFEPPGVAPQDQVRGLVGFSGEADDRAVFIYWRFAKDGASAGTTLQRVDVPFQPTAVTKRAGVTDTLYVAGWSPRAGRLLIHEWVLDDWALGASMPQGGGAMMSTFATPSVQMNEICCEASQMIVPFPMQGAAVQAYANELWLLNDESPRSIYALAIDEASLAGPPSENPVSEIYYDGAVPELASAQSLKAAQSDDGGFLILAQPRRLWGSYANHAYLAQEHPELYPAGAPPEPLLVYFQDADLDGVIDTIDTVTYPQFKALFSNWEARYVAPAP